MSRHILLLYQAELYPDSGRGNWIRTSDQKIKL